MSTPNQEVDLRVVLLHEDMVDKTGKNVTTSLTMIDAHDIARSSRTYGVTRFYVAHPSPALRKLARTLKTHWETGHGASYNPKRSQALAFVEICENFEEVLHKIDLECGQLPTLVATSAQGGDDRVKFSELRKQLPGAGPHLMMLGTGHGMSQGLLDRADMFLEPVYGPGTYNHLSVRSACAIMLDRLQGMHTA